MSLFPKLRICNCGSGEQAYEINDARGIFIAYGCEKCEKEKTKNYSHDVLTNSNYECDEQIEPEDETFIDGDIENHWSY